MAGKPSLSNRRSRSRNAIILIDYTNVFGVVSERTDNDQPDAVVLDLIKALNRHVTDHLDLKPVRSIAFANLPPGNMRGHRATGAWLSQGIEPRFTYARSTDEASAIEMAMEALELASNDGPETAFILLSGNQWFVPLVQRLQRRGHFVLMATLESPSQADHLPLDCQDAYLNANFLLDGPGRNLNFSSETSEDSSPESVPHKPTEIKRLEDDVVKRTLEFIDSYFGQYEEIYLTPLLRKLSEIYEDTGDEPKTLINHLEEAGAVWLEKRRGFPHNYTVLMMNEEHPDVAEIKEAHAAANADSYDEYYDEYPKADEEGSDPDAEPTYDDSEYNETEYSES